MTLPLGKVLVELGYATEQQIKEALRKQRELDDKWTLTRSMSLPSILSSVNMARAKWKDRRLGKILMEMGVVTPDQIEKALQRQKAMNGRHIGSISDEQAVALMEIPSLINSALNAYELLSNVMTCCNTLVDSTASALFICDEKKEKLATSFYAGGEEKLEVKVFPTGSVAAWVIANNEPILIADLESDARFSGKDNDFPVETIRSVACIPVRTKRQTVGAIEVMNKKNSSSFSQKDLGFLSIIANQVGMELNNIRLLAELDQSLRDLKKAQNRIIQIEKVRALGEMAGGVAHDFNNLLAGVLGRAQLLRRKLDTNEDPAVQKSLDVIEKSALDGAAMVRRLLDFTRFRRDEEGFTPVNINEMIKDAVEFTKTRWKTETEVLGKKLDLQMELNEVPPIAGEEAAIREVIVNLIFNAIEAMPGGGKIYISTQSNERGVFIKIRDTGIGMPEEFKNKAFDPFLTTKGPTNSGLGLSVSYGIVKRHDGNIEIESTEGKGTTVSIVLPIGNIKEHSSAPETKKIQRQKARILIIDDDETVRDLLNEVLTDAGHEVITAGHGRDGVQLFRNQPFDLVITDLAMPEISGWDVARSVKGEKPATLVALITGWGLETDDQKMKEYDIDLLIRKPFQLMEIIKQIDELLQS
ncbi:MAG: hybrid sensor histidine kinase/response regulator [Thermodesulfobacteriota bacterium]